MKIRINYGYTFNRGNYESERIDACVEYESNDKIEHVEGEMDVAFEYLKEYVWKKGGKL